MPNGASAQSGQLDDKDANKIRNEVEKAHGDVVDKPDKERMSLEKARQPAEDAIDPDVRTLLVRALTAMIHGPSPA